MQFDDTEIVKFISFFGGVCSNGGCKTDKVLSEWLTLKSYRVPLITNNKNMKYCEIWQKIFTNKDIVKECKNDLDIFELCLICLLMSAKLERMFSCMNRIKNHWRSNLGRDRLESLLRTSEEGPSLECFNPDSEIEAGYVDKMQQLNTG